jgi:hypothetical protein
LVRRGRARQRFPIQAVGPVGSRRHEFPDAIVVTAVAMGGVVRWVDSRMGAPSTRERSSKAVNVVALLLVVVIKVFEARRRGRSSWSW